VGNEKNDFLGSEFKAQVSNSKFKDTGDQSWKT
jgi:hypothetical protein